MINGKKISGILQEIIHRGDQRFLIVGIGINLVKSPKITSYPTTNLYQITGNKYRYEKVVKLLKLNFENNFLRNR